MTKITKMTMDVVYWATPGKVVATTQRVASASMAEAFGPAGTKNECRKVSQGAARQLKEFYGYKVVMWLREPFERAACAYVIWHKPPYTKMSPTEFAQKILGETNPHFSPQIKLHMAGDTFLPTVLYPFENLAQTWAFEFPKYPLSHVGAQPKRMSGQEFKSLIEPGVRKELEQHYAQDTESHKILMNMGMMHVDLVEEPCGAA
ncbi:MAG TPA: hypothetical protein VMW70_13935 [Burkholderiales bacterium]|nr:hypothetical protein [Burkholderiales bacterium]